MRKKCNTTKYTTARVVGEIIGIVGRVLKSFLFNILVFALGIGVGYSYIATTVHYHATKCSYADYISQANIKVDELTALDIQYSKKKDEIRYVLKCLNDKLAHGEHHECNSKIGKLLIRKGAD